MSVHVMTIPPGGDFATRSDGPIEGGSGSGWIVTEAAALARHPRSSMTSAQYVALADGETTTVAPVAPSPSSPGGSVRQLTLAQAPGAESVTASPAQALADGGSIAGCGNGATRTR